jgi:hypothetical protein
MANNAATLNGKLATQLRDATYAVWTTGEMDDLIAWSVGQLWPRQARPVDPTGASITLTSGTTYYSLPAGVLAASRVDWYDASGNEVGPVSGRHWELVGDTLAGTGKLHISNALTTNGGSLKVHGYGKYDVVTNLIPDEFVPLVLARARAEAYRRTTASRAQYEKWLAHNQVANMSINELIELINEADNEAKQISERHKTWQKPVSGRVG